MTEAPFPIRTNERLTARQPSYDIAYDKFIPDAEVIREFYSHVHNRWTPAWGYPPVRVFKGSPTALDDAKAFAKNVVKVED